MKNFIANIKQKAASDPKRLIFPESFDDRILKAIETILEEGTCHPILLGTPKEIKEQAQKLGLKIDWNRVQIIDKKTSEHLESLTQKYIEIRKNKAPEEISRKEITTDLNTFGTMMVQEGFADGLISGATCSTADTVRPALRIIKTKEKFHKISGFFFMIWEERLLFFADCAVMPDPNSYELADIALDTAETAARFGIQPKIAMLSFSTSGSAHHPSVDKVVEATKMVKDRCPELIVEGEMQVDAALVPNICQRKFPGSKVCGAFNCFIFPNLDAGNISYKFVQRLAGAIAIGPILQGLNKPVNDLSRGCSAHDISDLAAFTTVEAQGVHKFID